MRILIMPYTHQLGSTHVLVSVGKFLKKQGHDILVAGEGKYMQLAKDNGLETTKLWEIPIDKYREYTDSARLDYFTYDELLEVVSKEVNLYKRFSPDLVIYTVRFSAYISSKIYGVKSIGLTYASLSNYYALPITVPETHALYRFHNITPVWKLLNKFAGKVRDIIIKGYAKVYNQVLQHYNLPTVKNAYSLYEGDITWLYDIKEFAPVVDNTPKSFKYLGIVPNQTIKVQNVDIENKLKKAKKNGKKVLLLSMGSSGKLFPVILDILDKFVKKHKDIIIVATSCNHDVQKKYKNPNLLLTDFIAIDSVLKYTDGVIAHGGRGTIYDALRYGVPLIIIPHQSEQEWNANRLEQLQLGIKVSKVNFSKKYFLVELRNFLSNLSNYQNNANKFMKYIPKYDWKAVVLSSIKTLSNK